MKDKEMRNTPVVESWATSSQKQPRMITKPRSLLLRGCDSPCSPKLFSSASRAWWFCSVVAHRVFSQRNSFLSLTQRPDSKIVLKRAERAVVCPWCGKWVHLERGSMEFTCLPEIHADRNGSHTAGKVSYREGERKGSSSLRRNLSYLWESRAECLQNAH